MRLWSIQAKLNSTRHLLPRPWLTLDLGCGSYPRNPFGADLVQGCDIRADLDTNVKACNLATDPIPEDSESTNFITAYDFIEHIPRILTADTTRFSFIADNTFPYCFCWHPYGGPWGRIYEFEGKLELIKQRRMGPSRFTLLEKMT